MQFTINKKQYNSIPFDFETMCQLEERGIEIEDIGTRKTLSTIRAYFSMCSGFPNVLASKEINQHIVSGGNLTELMEVIDKEMEKSDFVNAVLRGAETPQETPQTQEIPQATPQIVTSEQQSDNTEA